MVPTRKQIQQGLTRLELWIDRTSMLLAAMRMTFPNADTKLMVFENVVVNGPDRSEGVLGGRRGKVTRSGAQRGLAEC